MIESSIRSMLSTDSDGTPSRSLHDLIEVQRSLDPPADWLRDTAVSDPAAPYGRKVLMAEGGVEVMVATWTRGRPCLPHDHGGAVGAVRVLQGRARHRIWRVDGGDLKLAREHTAGPGEILACGAELIHSMGDDGAAEPLMTLHMYTPEIGFMVVYDQERSATLVVDGDCGAWIPPAERIQAVRPGIHSRVALSMA